MTQMATLAARIVPLPVFGSSRALSLIERNLLVYRRSWVVFLSGFFEPVLYLFSIGVGIGELVPTVQVDGRTIGYPAFVAAAMLAASAMNGAIFDATYNVFFKLKYAKLYDAVLATPVSTGDVALGEITWSLMRGAVYSTGFVVVMLLMGLVDSAWALLALPAAILIGFTFGAVGMAATTFFRSWQDFEWVTIATLPMWLFSATFYPLTTYPGFLQPIVAATPLYQGVALVRGLTTGAVAAGLWWHVLYLVVLGVAGLVIASRRLERLLLK
jgi:lipooligosaccharide transport system permease protein